jgi:hypothetical protein
MWRCRRAACPTNRSTPSTRRGRPWWLIASRQERFAIRVVERIPGRSRTARVTVVEGTSHGSDILSPHSNLEAEIADWFAAKLGGIAAPSLWGGIEPGGHRVGFRRVTLRGSGHQILVDFWYPAGGTGPAMSIADYLGLSDDIRGSVPGSLSATLASVITGDSAGLDPGLTTRTLAAQLAAVREAPFAPGRFPLVLWTPRYGTTVAQSVLSEMLASHGLVVGFARPATSAPLPFELPTPSAKEAELEARVADMQVAFRHLATMPSVDARMVGVVAWSYTGEMATAFQLREPAVALVAGLSTNLLGNWVFQSPEAALTLDRTRLGSAYAVITQRPDVPPALSRVSGPKYFVEMPGLAHGSFNAIEGYWPSLLGITKVQPFSASGPRGIRGYHAIGAMLLRLLRHHVVAGSKERLTDLVLTSGLEPGTVVVAR